MHLSIQIFGMNLSNLIRTTKTNKNKMILIFASLIRQDYRQEQIIHTHEGEKYEHELADQYPETYVRN